MTLNSTRHARLPKAFDLVMKLVLPLLFILVLNISSAAETVEHNSFRFWMPQSWTQTTDADNDLVVSSPDGTASALFFVLPPDSTSAIEYGNDAIEAAFTNVEVDTQFTETRLNEQEALVSDGTGVIDEVAMKWAIRIFNFEDKTVLIVAFYAEEFGDEHGPNLNKMIDSLKEASDPLGST